MAWGQLCPRGLYADHSACHSSNVAEKKIDGGLLASQALP